MRLFRLVSLTVFAVGFVALFAAPPVHAETVRIQPLEYRAQLKPGEKKKGFVDVTNPTGEAVKVRLYVNGFSQVDDKGNLTFFGSEQVSKGLLLDYDTATIGSRQTLRLYFVIDGAKLPTGDVFAAIFAETMPLEKTGTRTAVRVGTLVMLTNQTPGSQRAQITRLDMPYFDFGDSIRGEVAVKNPASPSFATGFFPDIKVEVDPWGSEKTYKGPLIFAGRTRTMSFAVPSDQFGVYKVTVSAGGSSGSQYVFVMTGKWRWIVPAVFVLIVAVWLLGWRLRRSGRAIRFRRRYR